MCNFLTVLANGSRLPWLSVHSFSVQPMFAVTHSTQIWQCKKHRVHKLIEMKQGECICPLSWSVKNTATLYVMVTTVKGAWANFSIMMECTPESGGCHPVVKINQLTSTPTISSLVCLYWSTVEMILDQSQTWRTEWRNMCRDVRGGSMCLWNF
jgi:hypothetical protein